MLIDLSNKVHPLVLGEIFRSREQIRFLADKLLSSHLIDKEKVEAIVNFLCSDSGSHDYTINRREALELGLPIEKPSDDLYSTIRQIHASYAAEMKLLQPFTPAVELGTADRRNYQVIRGLIEGRAGGCYAFVTEGTVTKVQVASPAAPGGVVEGVSDQKSFEGWKKLQ